MPTAQITQLQEQNHALRVELEELQHAAAHEKEEMRAEMDRSAREVVRVKQQMEKMAIAAGEAQALKDEVEELRQEASKVSVEIDRSA
jgi:hypothetical protein